MSRIVEPIIEGSQVLDFNTSIPFKFHPVDNSTLVGIFTGTKVCFNSKSQENFTLYEFYLDDGRSVSIPEYGALRNGLMKLETGDRVFIHDTGEELDTGSGNPMKVFQFKIYKQAQKV